MRFLIGEFTIGVLVILLIFLIPFVPIRRLISQECICLSVNSLLSSLLPFSTREKRILSHCIYAVSTLISSAIPTTSNCISFKSASNLTESNAHVLMCLNIYVHSSLSRLIYL